MEERLNERANTYLYEVTDDWAENTASPELQEKVRQFLSKLGPNWGELKHKGMPGTVFIYDEDDDEDLVITNRQDLSMEDLEALVKAKGIITNVGREDVKGYSFTTLHLNKDRL